VVQIVDREKLLKGPKDPTAANLRFPEIGRLVMSPFNGAHTAFPLSKMPIAEFGRNSSGTRLIKIGDGNFGAVDPDGARNCTYAARRAGNDDKLAFEMHPKFLSFALRD